MRAWTTLGLTSLLLLPLIPDSSAYFEMAAESPPGEPYFPQVWNGGSYSESSNPLKRFTRFPVSDPYGTGRVVLKSLPYIQPRPVTDVDASIITDELIADALASLGVTKDQVNQNIDLIYQDDEAMSAVRDLAKEKVNASQYKAAVQLMTGTDADLTYWCGADDSANPLRWVIAIPAVVSCRPSGAPNVSTWTRIEGKPDVSVRFVGNQLIRQTITLNLTSTSVGTNASDVNRSTFGITYNKTSAAIHTRLQKTMQVSLNVTNLERPAFRLGNATWTAVTGDFAKEDKVIVTDGTILARNRTLTQFFNATSSRFGVDYSTDTRTANAWTLSETFYDKLVVNRTIGLTHFDAGYQFQFNITNETDGVTVRTNITTTAGGTKRDISVQNPLSVAYHQAEFKGTLFIGSQPIVDIQFAGLPNDPEPPEFPRANIIRFDFGTEADEVASIDISKGSSFVDGYYRTVLITSRVESLPFISTSSLVSRARISGGLHDPWMAPRDIHIESSASLLDARSASTANTTVGLSYPTQYQSNISAPPGATISPPTTARWIYGPQVTTCTTTCTGTFSPGSSQMDDSVPFNARFWAMLESTETTVDDISPYVCAFTIGGSCP